MQAYGSDRVRAVVGKVILQSRIPKGWTPRTPKTLTHAEFPGTAVLWDDEYFEVVSADVMQTGVRYVLEPWREDHTIRSFQAYDAESEAQRVADWERAQRQRSFSGVARIAGIVAGHAPAPVQNRLANELGLSPSRMTLISCIPAVVLLGLCAWLKADAMLRQVPSPIPVWLWIVAAFLVLESLVRFYVAMSQNRAMGSLFGGIVYTILFQIAPGKLPPPFTERGNATPFLIPPPDDVALRDSLTVRGPLLTLLTPAEQRRLADRFGFDYRQHSAFALAWSILAVTLLGAVSSIMKLQDGRGASAFLSLIVAGGLALEQILRLFALQRGPAGSVLGVFVRPFMRKMLA
jgi:hypothetical protein